MPRRRLSSALYGAVVLMAVVASAVPTPPPIDARDTEVVQWLLGNSDAP